MPQKRQVISIETKLQVLHEAGYKCSNPTCRTIITLDIHHLEYVSQGGSNTPSNLLVLCPNCHALHHKNHIPEQSIRAWKMLQLTLNEAFNKHSVDILLALDKIGGIVITGDGLLNCASLISANLIFVDDKWIGYEKQKREREGMALLAFGGRYETVEKPISIGQYHITLTEKGRSLVSAWKSGNQNDAVHATRKNI